MIFNHMSSLFLSNIIHLTQFDHTNWEISYLSLFSYLHFCGLYKGLPQSTVIENPKGIYVNLSVLNQEKRYLHEHGVEFSRN